MKAALKATAVLGSASAFGIVGGLVSTKVAALTVGPMGVGAIGLLQTLVGLLVMIAGMGLAAAMVREGAPAVAEGDARTVAALRRGAWWLILAAGVLAAMLLLAFSGPVGELVLGERGHERDVMAMALALIFALATALQQAILNAHRRVAELARASIIGTAINVGLTVFLLWSWREAGIVPAVLGGFAANCLVSYYFMRSKVPGERLDLSGAEVRAGAGRLLRFGLPYAASQLVGAGVLLMIPVLVLHTLGSVEVGFYRAAASIAINYLGFLPVALAQDFYPRASAAKGAAALNALVNEQLRLVLLLVGPLILLMLALVPYLIPLVYSAQFAPAGELLEWQLIGDLFRFSCWVMSYVIIVSLGSRAFFWTELFGGALLLLTGWIGLGRLGLPGLGIAFVATSAVACLLCWFVLRKAIGLRWSLGNKLLFLAFAGAMGLVRALPHLGLGEWRTPVALALALLLGSLSFYLIWKVIGGWRALLAWRNRAPVPTGHEGF